MAQQPSPGGFLPPEWSQRLKGAQVGFIAGIVVGLIFGWIFHSVISLAVQFGLVLFLLIPIIVIGWLWFRSQRASRASQGGQPGSDRRTGSWTTVIDVQTVDATRYPQSTAEQPSREPQFVDVPLFRPSADQRPNDIEAELEALKKAQERGS
jgi:nicotinamide riboside transporter PnuC